jgi:carbon-nitrogen hydrolase
VETVVEGQGVTVRVAAIQLEVTLADVRANLATCEALAREAADQGAQAIALPEFFTTGAAFVPELRDAALAPNGAATAMLIRVAQEAGVLIGGSFLCRDADGEVRNAFFLAGPGGLLGRHDKDLPTMWENALYIGGSDDGVIDTGELTVGAAVCWEFMRSATARRLRGRVDLVVGGSNWWSIRGGRRAPTRAAPRPGTPKTQPGHLPHSRVTWVRRSSTARSAARSRASCPSCRSRDIAASSRAAHRSPPQMAGCWPGASHRKGPGS